MAKKSTKRKNITLRVDKDLADQWDKVVELHGFSKSDMLNSFLAEVLPILLETDMQKLMSKSSKKVGEAFTQMGEIIENADAKK